MGIMYQCTWVKVSISKLATSFWPEEVEGGILLLGCPSAGTYIPHTCHILGTVRDRILKFHI